MSEFKIIHTINGSWPIIAKMSKLHRDEYYTLENPLGLMYYIQNENDNQVERIRVINLLVYANTNKVDIKADHVLFMYEPTDSVVEFYKENLKKKYQIDAD